MCVLDVYSRGVAEQVEDLGDQRVLGHQQLGVGVAELLVPRIVVRIHPKFKAHRTVLRSELYYILEKYRTFSQDGHLEMYNYACTCVYHVAMEMNMSNRCI